MDSKVENQMDKPATAIKVHCKSKDDDMGEHILWNGMHTTFSFKPSVFNKTFFWCDVFWNDRWVVFDVYMSTTEILVPVWRIIVTVCGQ
uniref:S-protein homolog n=1 Tax=Kalanchoe fedtschenkoi TaxID=63787 RepID=A0A7N0UH93_KALFE